MKPKLSTVVVFHNMRREAPRTLFSLAPAYQQGVSAADYEVIAVDNGSTEPLDPAELELAPNVRLVFHRTDSRSPAEAVNVGVGLAQADVVMICVDGARILSPGIVRYCLSACRAFSSPLVCTLGWHIGSEIQNVSMSKGYSQAAEDQLLASIDWKANGYALFSISTLARSCAAGWFSSIAESNCLALAKQQFWDLGGYSTEFQAPGGGLVNLDFFGLACEAVADSVVLLGEGTFHQFHGGVATNVPLAQEPWSLFEEEYRRVRGKSYTRPRFEPHYLGHLPQETRRFLRAES